MYALTWRELVSIGRAPGFWAATIGYTFLLFMIVLVWGHGLPVTGAGTNWQQFNAAQSAILSVLLPWTAARCGPVRRTDLVMLSLVTAAPPSRLLMARWLAVSAALIGLTLAALPTTLLMQEIAAIPPMSIAASFAGTAALCALVAAVTNACVAIFDGALSGWLAATTISVAAGLLMPPSPAVLPIWLLMATGATFVISKIADSQLLHLAQEAAA